MPKFILKILFWGGFIGAMVAAPAVAAGTYTIDHVHSNIGFAVRHMMVSEVKGEFTDYEGTVIYDPEYVAETKIDVVIRAKSIDTRLQQRDDHLRASEFLKTDEFPLITFKSRGVNKTDQGVVIVGDLTIRGRTKTISIPAQISGPYANPLGGGEVIGIVGEAVINRQDFGVSWNKAMDAGGYVVADDVKLIISVEAKR
ncbi:MAG TPA: YceI family protein [Candidatus Omnitrophota bacterium]|jgi:polyisoprenoid-binding protein YceI|nr:YceI family protein [Candidatus Omnitrophota bacterium]